MIREIKQFPDCSRNSMRFPDFPDPKGNSLIFQLVDILELFDPYKKKMSCCNISYVVFANSFNNNTYAIDVGNNLWNKEIWLANQLDVSDHR